MAVILGRKPGGSGGGGGSQPYAAGTDRLVCRVLGVTYPSGTTTTIDWTDSVEFQAGTAVTVVGAQIVFVEDGCYSVEIHLPAGVRDDGDPSLSVEAMLKLPLSGSEWSDGADTSLPSGLEGGGALDAKYIWCQNAGDTVDAKIQIRGVVGGLGDVWAQIVKLSNVAAGDEFA